MAETALLATQAKLGRLLLREEIRFVRLQVVCCLFTVWLCTSVICRSLFVCLKVVHYSGWENTIADEWEAESLCWRPSKEQLLSEYMIAKLLKKKQKNFTFFSDSVADGKIKSPDPQLKRQKVQRRASSPCTKGIIFRSAAIHQALKWQKTVHYVLSHENRHF